jgi:hypothetical protein
MPEKQRGQGSPRSLRDSSRNPAKTTAATPALRRKAERGLTVAAAKPAVQRRKTESSSKAAAAAKPAERRVAERRVTKAAAKPAVERRNTERRVKAAEPKPAKESKATAKSKPAERRVAERRVTAAAVKPAVERRKAERRVKAAEPKPVEESKAAVESEPGVATEPMAAVEPMAAAEPEQTVELMVAAEAEPVAAVEAAPTEEPWLEVEPNAAEEPWVEVEPTVAVEPGLSSSPVEPFVERRKTTKTLLERRLVDPSAKERRVSDLAAQESGVTEPAAKGRTKADSGAKDSAAADFAAKAKERVGADSASNPTAGPKVAADPVTAERGAESVAGGLRVREQQNLFQETALWMRKSGALLIGLNVVTLIAVFLFGRARPSQLQEMAEMRKAAVMEMQRTAAASGEAAYAACLGSQTARNLLLQMKLDGAGTHIGAGANALQAIAATHGQTAQLAFDVEKTTSVSAHLPVLFHLGIQNTGSGPALDAKVWGEVKVLDNGKDPDFKYDDPALTKKAISPNDPEAKVVLYTTDAGMVVPLKDLDVQRVSSGTAYVVAYGRMLYTDTAGARHWAEFCHYITEPAGAGRRPGRCMGYNGSGVSGEVVGRALARPIERSSEPQREQQSAAVTLPEIACEVPKDEKN